MNKHKKSILIGLIAVVIIMAVSLVVSKNKINKDETYTVGVVTSLSGPGASLGKPWVQGMELAVEEINAQGGINGKNIKLVVEDDSMNTGKSATAANFIIGTENPDVLTTLFHISAIAMNPISENAKTPLVTASFARSVLDNPYTFKINFDSLTGCEDLIRYAKENSQYKKLGVLMSKTGYNEFCLEGAKKAELDISEYWYEFGEKDYRTHLLKAKQDGVDALLTVGIDFEYIEMFDQINELGLDMSFFCATASECIFNESLASKASKLKGNVLSVDFVDPEALPDSDFAGKYNEKYEKAEGIVLTYSMIGYDQMMILKDVFEECNAGDKECIFDGLKKYDGVGSGIINSSGFEDRALQLDNDVYEFVDNKWRLIR
ncbi:MAG: amino acid ABC transporter substrate-binding protein [Candidatus Magasanikbacteria bacterium]|jgi:branched-chain amino acid transport system substrate-binding protein|nr:amino acid ABC transporter substrate-binding protein [Candidatus Magasanikbacteria bacterium]MBT4071510.1 amino acid ABC transporter substrate-binding protein [Candidatus Magasanikbacteria bacterium]